MVFMPGISMGQNKGCLHMPFMKPYYPISQSWYKSHKSRVNVSKVTSLLFICSLRNHWAHPILHWNLGIPGWPWQPLNMWWVGVSWPFALYQSILTSYSETWGGWPFFNNIKGWNWDLGMTRGPSRDPEILSKLTSSEEGSDEQRGPNTSFL